MPVFYREKVIDPENSQNPLKQQPLHQSNGQSYQYQTKTSNNYPGSGSSTATTATDFPANFPKIPPPKGVIDDKQLERMAEQLMKGQQPTWDGQQFSPPGWTRHSQQSYTIETVVEHPPETRPIYVGKHYESVPPKTTGIPPQTQPKQQFSPQHIRTAQPPPSNYSYQAYNQPVSPQRQPTRTAQPPTSSYSSSQVYGQPQKPQEYYQQPEQLKHQEQKYTKTFQQKPQIPAQVNIQEQQKQFIPPQRQQQNGTPYREERKDIVDSANFPSQQQYSKTLTEFREQTNGQPTQQPPQKLQLQQKQWEAVQSPQEKWNQTQWQQSQQWQSQQQQPQQTQQQWEKTLQWQQAPKQPEQWPQQQSKQWQQTEQPKQQEWQKPQQSQQKYITQQDQQQVQQQYSPQKPYIPQEKEQTQLKQQPIETNVQAQQTQNLSGTTKLQQKETEKQNIEQDLGEEYDGPPPELQLAQADPGKINEKQQENVHQNGWQQEENYDHQPYRSHHLNQRQLQETRNNYDEPLYISAGGDDGYQHQYHQYYSPNSQIYWDSVYNDEWALRGANPPSFTTGPVWGDHLAYAQRVNYEKRRAESEKQRRHHTPVPGSADYGYLFGGMDFVDHNNFDSSTYVGEPFNEMQERHSRRDLHWGPPRRRGDFFGLDYRTMLPEEEQHRSHSAEDSNFYQGYQALPPRKNFRLCGHFTADHNAPLNIAEAQGLDEFDSQYWVGDTLSNQKVRPEHPLTEEQKRTFALLYGPGGFKPDHRTVIPEPKPEEPVQFSVTIGPKKEKKEQTEGYVNPMKVEGESWMLGQRGEYDGYGKLLHSTAEEHLPFHRPRQFPARVPNWAVERMNQMGRGARSLDRSLFLPSWAKVPQPQPPFWVKRDGSKVAGGWQMPKQEPQQREIQQDKRENVQLPPQKQQYVVKQSQTINSPQQKELTLPQKTEQPSPQPSPQQSQKTQIGSWGQPIMQKLPPSTQIEQKVEQKQPQKDEADKNLQKSKQQIFTQSHQRPNYQQQTNVTATQSQQAVQPNQHHTLHQSFTSAPDKDTQNQQFTQLIVTPSKTHQTTFKPAKQPLTSRQEQQQQSQQQQQYYDFYEGNGQTRTFPQQEQFKQFTSPGGQFYGKKGESEVKVNQTTHPTTTNPSGQYYGRIPAQQRTEQQYPYKMQQQPQQVHQLGGDPKIPQNQPQGQTKEESGLENLAKLKLGKFPMRESLEAQQSLESDPSINSSNKRQPQQFMRQVRDSPGQQQVTREEWRFTGPPQKGAPGGHQLLQSSTTTTTTTSSISGDNQ